MLKKTLGRAVAAAATAAVLVVPTAGTVAPQIANEGCTYNDTVTTYSHVKVAKPVMRRGQKNWATVTVRSGAGTPQGTVTFKLETRQKVTKRLHNGHATFAIPSGLRAGRTYGIDAYYHGKCRFRDSSDSAYVTVKRAKHHHHRRHH